MVGNEQVTTSTYLMTIDSPTTTQLNVQLILLQTERLDCMTRKVTAPQKTTSSAFKMK